MNPYLIEILKEMCNTINVDFTKIDFTTNNWYWAYTWTKEQEATFIKWMTDYLYNNAKARKVMTTCRKNKKELKEVAKDFVWIYGWKLEVKNEKV